MIGIVETIYEKYVTLELYSMHIIITPIDSIAHDTIHEGDLLCFKQGYWHPLSAATNSRRSSIDQLINQLFIDPT